MVTIALIIGFPVALITAWAYALTPAGTRLSGGAEAAPSVSQGARQTVRYIVTGLLLLTLADGGVWFMGRDARWAQRDAFPQIEAYAEAGDREAVYGLLLRQNVCRDFVSRLPCHGVNCGVEERRSPAERWLKRRMLGIVQVLARTPANHSLAGRIDAVLRKEVHMSQFVVAAKVSEIPEQSVKLVELVGKSIALFNLGGEFYALDDQCTHEGGPLSEGFIESDEVECPWHGAHFDIKSGRVTLDPATEDVARYNVRVSGENVEIEI